MNQNVIDSDTTVKVMTKDGNEIKTNLGDLLWMSGVLTGQSQQKLVQVSRRGEALRKIVDAAAPSPIDTLATQMSNMAATAPVKPSVIVPAKKAEDHSAVTIVITKEQIPGEEDGSYYLCVNRIRKTGNKMAADGKMNFGFDKSYCYYHCPTPADKQPIGEEWPVRKTDRQVNGVTGTVSGTFWSRYVPMDAVTSLLDGLRRNFSGATLLIDGQQHRL